MAREPKKYTGSVYIGVVGADITNGQCINSIDNIVRRNGDIGPRYLRATKGYESRQLHLNNWYNDTRHDFLLLLDQDMVFQPDTLERLRSHRLPFVSGFYLRRRWAPILPVWYKLPPKHTWPMEPWVEDPERGKLHPLGASGWGCMLLHRDVVTATKPILKGEDEIIEDDMDIWPYDLARVFGALRGLRLLVEERPSAPTFWPALQYHLEMLEEEIRLLRGQKDVVGSDLRYPFFAREVGFTLMGDPDTRPSHMLDFPLSPDEMANQDTNEMEAEARKQIGKLRRDLRKVQREVMAA